MKGSYFLCFLAVVLLLTFSASPVQAHWDTTIGLSSVFIGDELGKEIDDGFGLSVGWTNRFSDNFAFDFVWDRSLHDTDVAGATDITYQRYNFGLRYFVLSLHSLELYAAAGMTIHDLWFNDDNGGDISGVSLYYGAGLEVPFDNTARLCVTLDKSSWEGDWDPGNVDASTIDIKVALQFYFSFAMFAH